MNIIKHLQVNEDEVNCRFTIKQMHQPKLNQTNFQSNLFDT